MSNELMVVRHVFEGADLESVLWNDRPCWVARHIGERIGYAQAGKAFAEQILGDWSAEFVEGADFAFLEGEDLQAFKAISPDMAGGTRHVARALVLFESGAHLALLKTSKPAGVRLRRELADRILPQLVRTGRYESAPTASGDLDRRVAGLELHAAQTLQMLQALTQAVTGLAQGLTQQMTALTTATRAERMTVEMHDTRITVTNQSPVPEGWVRTWRGGAGLVGVPWTVFKREFEALESALVPRFAIRYEEPVVTTDRRGMPIAIPRPAIAFSPEIGQEMARLKGGGSGPLFS